MRVKSNLNKKSVYTPLCNYTQVLRSIHNSQPFNYSQVFVKSLRRETHCRDHLAPIKMVFSAFFHIPLTN